VQAPPWKWAQGSIGASLVTDYFTSSANYDNARGSYQRLIGDNNVASWSTEVRARYGIREWFSPYVGVGFANTNVVDVATERSNSAVSDVHAGADFRIQTRWIRIFPQIEGSFPTDKTNPSQTTPLTSDGVPWLRASVFFQKPMRYLAIYAHGGVRIPGEGLAKLLLYGAGAEVPLGDLFVIGGGIEGFETVMKDSLTQAERERTSNLSLGGSHMFWSYNPALIEGRIWARFRPDPRVWVRAGYAKTIDGIRTAEGQSFNLTLSFNAPWEFGTAMAANRTRVRKQPGQNPAQSQALKSFKVDSERTDPDVFTPDEDYAPDASSTLNDTEKMLEEK
jgi:hypothetical protein